MTREELIQEIYSQEEEINDLRDEIMDLESRVSVEDDEVYGNVGIAISSAKAIALFKTLFYAIGPSRLIEALTVIKQEMLPSSNG